MGLRSFILASVQARTRKLLTVPLPVPRLRSTSVSSIASDDSNGTALVESGSSTPQLTRRSDQLAMTALTKSLAKASDSQQVAIPACQPDEINWTAVEIGLHLAHTALQCRHTDPDYDPDTLREMLEDGVKYLNSGLPQQQLLLSSGDRDFGRMARRSDNTLIRSGTASLVCWFIGLFMLGIPILASLINWALEYERRHRVTEKAIQNAGTAGVNLSHALLRASQSEYGEYAKTILQDVLDGARDGVIDYSVKSGSIRINTR